MFVKIGLAGLLVVLFPEKIHEEIVACPTTATTTTATTTRTLDFGSYKFFSHSLRMASIL